MSAWKHEFPECHDVQCQVKLLEEQTISKPTRNYAFSDQFDGHYILCLANLNQITKYLFSRSGYPNVIRNIL